MKTLNIPLEDKKYKALKKVKGNRTWHKFIDDIIKKDKILLIIDKYKDLMSFKEIIPISALTDINIDILEDKIFESLPEVEKIYSDDEVSIQSQRFLLSEIIREKILNHVREELPFVQTIEDAIGSSLYEVLINSAAADICYRRKEYDGASFAAGA